MDSEKKDSIYECTCKVKYGTGHGWEQDRLFHFEIDVKTDEIMKITIKYDNWDNMIYPCHKNKVDKDFMMNYLQYYRFCDFPDFIKILFDKIALPLIRYDYRGHIFKATTLKDLANNVPKEVVFLQNYRCVNTCNFNDFYISFLFQGYS